MILYLEINEINIFKFNLLFNESCFVLEKYSESDFFCKLIIYFLKDSKLIILSLLNKVKINIFHKSFIIGGKG